MKRVGLLLFFFIFGFVGAYLLPFKPVKSVVVYRDRPLPDGYVLVKESHFKSIKDSLFYLDTTLNQTLAKYKNSLTLIAQMQVQLDSLKGGGQSKFETDTLAIYDDSVINIKYFKLRNLFNYTLKPKQFYVTTMMVGDTLIRMNIQHLGQVFTKSLRVYHPKENRGLFGYPVYFYLGLETNVMYRTLGIGGVFDFYQKGYQVSFALNNDMSIRFGLYKRIGF